MESLRCAEYLCESPSTSAIAGGVTSTSSSQNRRRSKLSEHNRSFITSGRLVLGQLPTNRKRPAPCDKLNTAQWPCVLPLPDKTIHQDDRCLDSLFKAQNMTGVNANYFFSVQTHITSRHRQQAVDWLFDVCIEEQCEPDVFPLAVSFVDRFLSVQNIFRDGLQALTSVCLFIASKVKAPQPLDAKRIAYFTDGAVRQEDILGWELLVLGKLKWDVSTPTPLDFLDQVAARYSQLHSLGEACKNAVHRIQREEKFAFLVPSMQAAVCLLFSAAQSGSATTLAHAEHALFQVLRCEPRILHNYVDLVERAVYGSERTDSEQNVSPGDLIAPPSSGNYRSPAATPPSMLPPLANLTTMSPSFTSPEHCSRASDDSGFNSGFSSPAAAFDFRASTALHESASSSRRHPRRSAATRVTVSRRSMDRAEESVLINFYPTEHHFLTDF